MRPYRRYPASVEPLFGGMLWGVVDRVRVYAYDRERCRGENTHLPHSGETRDTRVTIY